MTQEEHAALLADYNAERIQVGIDRIIARKVFHTVSLDIFEEQTHSRPILQKIMVLFSYVLANLFAFMTILLSFVFLKWWGLLVTPMFLLTHIYFWSRSTVSKSRRGKPEGVILFCTALTFGLFLRVEAHCWWILGSWTASCIARRANYSLATLFLREMVLSNHRSFHLFSSAVNVVSVESGRS